MPHSDDSSPHLLLIDGSGFLFRAYHSLPPLTAPDGTPVGAVYGFINMLTRLREDFPCERVAVIFDAGRITFRNKLYPEYKAHRPEPPEDLIPQFPLVREAVRAFDLPCVELADYEADDVIATYACQAVEKGWEVTIVSSDKDLMQLVNGQVTMLDTMKNRRIDSEGVQEKFGVTPEKVVEVQALIGDSVDNVPGVPGIGPKIAAELIGQYGTLENLLAHAGEIKQTKRRENLIEYAEMAQLSKELVTLCCEVPVPEPLEALHAIEPSPDKLLPFLRQYGFRSLIAKYERYFHCVEGGGEPVPHGGEDTPAPPAREAEYRLITCREELEECLRLIGEKGAVGFDTETDSLNAARANLVGFSLSWEPGKAVYVPLGHIDKAGGEGDLFAETSLCEGQLPLEEAVALVRPMLEDPAILKVGHNIKYDAVVMARYGVRIGPVEDSMLLSYVLSAGQRHGQGLDELAQRHLGLILTSYSEVIGKGREKKASFAEVELESACHYAAEDADATLQLARRLRPELHRERLVSVYEELERPLIPVIAAMESAGIRVNVARLRALSRDFGGKMAGLETQIHALAGHPFNVASPKQLGEVLFEEMGLEGGKKSKKSGAYGTDQQVLEGLAAQGHDLPQKVLAWRQLAKLKSTYTDALVAQADPQSGRVHTAFSMAVTSTGRLSSSDPNLQNIPIRSEEGRTIRTAFVAGEGMQLISADYSQIELRILAHIAGIEALKQAFRDGRDIHAVTASQVFGVAADSVDSEMRRKAKTINFGIIYGISAHGLAVRLGISRSDAAAYIEAYFTQYPGIRAYMDRTKETARQKGYVTTLDGRRCYVPDINAKNPNLRAFAERAAINAPIQGTAADIIKRAMIRIHKMLAEESSLARMLLQVHDELVFEAPAEEAERLAPRLQKRMEQAADLDVPLVVEYGVGANWGEIH